jgi:hypothetical protein
MIHGVQRDAALKASGLIAQTRGHPGMRTLMHTERKDEDNEFKYRFNQVSLLQKDSPWPETSD